MKQIKQKFRGTVAAMSEAQQIQGRTAVINKATVYVIPMSFDQTTGEPSRGEFSDAFPIECINENIATAAAFKPGDEVFVTAYLSANTRPNPDNTISSFLSLRLASMVPAVAMQQQQVQQPMNQPTAQQAQPTGQQPGAFGAPFPPYNR